MKAKFKKGDKVVLISRGVHPVETQDWTLGGTIKGKEHLQFGTEYVVQRARITESVEFIDFEDILLTHIADKFDLKLDVITIILRRPVDRKSIEKFLDSAGYKQDGDPFDYRKTASRIINVHLRGTCDGDLTYNGTVTYDVSTKQAIVENNGFMRGWFGHENIKVIKSKPSVSKAIKEIEKYL